MFKIAALLFVLLTFSARPGSVATHLEKENPEITAQEILSHVRYLASDDLRGRRAGTEGSRKAAAYIANHFKKYGLKPLGDDGTYYQNFSFTSGVKLGKSNSFRLQMEDKTLELQVGRDFIPLGFSTSTRLDGELVFAGYGISAPKLDYDDYDELDVRDKIVLVLRYTPAGYDPKGPFYQYSSLRYKSTNAREKGAKGIIFITPLSQDEEKDFEGLRSDSSFHDSGVLAVMLRREIAKEILSFANKDLKDLELTLSNKKNDSFHISNVKAHIKTDIVKERATTSNVIGLLEGSDPILKSEVIIVGAHYDHLGLGHSSSQVRDEKRKGRIHNGADDNASGVAGLLELAEHFSPGRNSLKRSILFTAFSAEELGLLGSSFYAKNPKTPLENTVAMINMDMIGRLRNDTITVLGAGSSPEWKAIASSANSDIGLSLKISDSSFAPSDQLVFYARRIPVLQFFTGVHKDYHTPDDDWQKINQEGIRKILLLVSGIIWELDRKSTRIAFSKVKDETKSWARFNVYLGTIPDYSDESDGVKLMGVKEGSPAEEAGIESRDIIVGLNGKIIKNIYDYVYVLSETKPGVPTEIEVIREKRRIKLSIVPEARAQVN